MKNEKRNQNEKHQNDRGFFKGRLSVGLFAITVGIFIVMFFDTLRDITVFIFFLVTILLLKEVWRVGFGALKKYSIEIGENVAKFLVPMVIMLIYVILGMGLFISLLLSDNGQGWFLLILASPGIFDGIAFIVGTKMGDHRIKALNNVSSKKTWEGTIAGTCACVCLALVILAVKFSYLEFWQMILVALVISVCAFFGDLIASKFKRIMKVKDSGTILKGHGGILDRIDSQLLTIYGMFLLTFWFL